MQKNVQRRRRGEVSRSTASCTTTRQTPENFAPEVRAAIAATPAAFAAPGRSRCAWGQVEFISDVPGKNDGQLPASAAAASARRRWPRWSQGAQQRSA